METHTNTKVVRQMASPSSTIMVDVHLNGVDLKKITEKWRDRIRKRKQALERVVSVPVKITCPPAPPPEPPTNKLSFTM